MEKKKICIFCASSSGFSSKYLHKAFELGQYLVKRNFDLVYGGAKVGLMNAVAEGVLEAGGHVTGVLPQDLLNNFEVKHEGLTHFYHTETMHQRKEKMYELSDAFLAIPGGFGTLDEICEVVTWRQIKIHNKPCGIFNMDGFYNHFLKQIEHTMKEGLMKGDYKEDLSIIESISDLDRFFNQL